MHHIQEYFSHIGKSSFLVSLGYKIYQKALDGVLRPLSWEESLPSLSANMIQDLSLHSLIWRTTHLAPLTTSQGIKMRTNPHRMMQKRVFTIFNHLPNIRAAYETIISKASKGNEEYALSYCSCNLNKNLFSIQEDSIPV